MPTLITNTTVVTSGGERAVLYGAAIAVGGTRIAAIGPSDEVARDWPDADQVDGRGKAVFPGLINCHAHLVLTAGRGLHEDFGFPSQLDLPTYNWFLLSEEERQAVAVLGTIEAIRSGTTTFL